MKHRPDEPLVFLCNICDRQNEATLDQLTRDAPSCSKCGSSVRLRSIIQILGTELLGRSLRLSEMPRRPDLVGAGLSCWEGYARPLARRMSYRNTFYHRQPRLDITHLDPALHGTLDFLIATDVFEHVDPPVARAFENSRKLLKPGGVFIFSVPFSHPGIQGQATVEHFPNLHQYEIQQIDGRYRLKNTTQAGDTEYFDDLVFHGGPGSTLELRLFSEWSLLQELERAGFADVTIYSGSDLRHGIHWADPWSVPMAARVSTSGT